MTWRELYWQDAASDPAYFAAVEFATVLDGDYGTRMFGLWIEERCTDSHEMFGALEYLLTTNQHGEDAAETIDALHRRLVLPWEDRAMATALDRTAGRFEAVPVRVRDDADVLLLSGVLSADPDAFRLWREELQQAAVDVLRDGGVLDTFLDDCLNLAHEAKEHRAGTDEEQVDGSSSSVDEDLVSVVHRGHGVSFAEPADVVADRHPWLDHSFRLGVAFTINPEANSFLPEPMGWDEAQDHLGRWGVDLGEFVEHMDEAVAASPVRAYRDERITINVMGTSVHVEVTIDSALNAHNTGIIATLDSDGAYTHYVQFKDLVMFYVDENDMNTPIYNVLKTFGDRWVGGDAESYVVRHGKGRKAHLTVTPVKASHQGSLVAVVRRCSDGMTVRVLD